MVSLPPIKLYTLVKVENLHAYASLVKDCLLTTSKTDEPFFMVHRGIFLAITFRGLTPSEAPTTPSTSMRSMIRAARL